MLVRKVYKFRIYPNKAQQAALGEQFGHDRFKYNRFLFVRQEYERKERTHLSW
jgi:transposase